MAIRYGDGRVTARKASERWGRASCNGRKLWLATLGGKVLSVSQCHETPAVRIVFFLHPLSPCVGGTSSTPSPYLRRTCVASSSVFATKSEDEATQVRGWYDEGTAQVRSYGVCESSRFRWAVVPPYSRRFGSGKSAEERGSRTGTDGGLANSLLAQHSGPIGRYSACRLVF